MPIPNVVIDASNLHSGGGVQVAASFIDEMLRLANEQEVVDAHPWLITARVEASTEVLGDLQNSAASQVQLLNRKWTRLAEHRPLSPSSDLRFTIFGPFFGKPNALRHIIGFADGTLISSTGAGKERSLLDPRRYRQRIRNATATRSYRSADRLVVETDGVRDNVARHLNFPIDSVVTIPNTVNHVFTEPHNWAAVEFTRPEEAQATFAYVTRLYPHKNIDLIGSVGTILKNDFGVEVRFVLTLKEQEWAQLQPETRAFSINVGPLQIDQVPTLLRRVDGSFFPSLLESFSATPIEAMALGLPLFASDRDFVRTTCFDYPIYFEPTDPRSAAAEIAHAIRSRQLVPQIASADAGRTLQWSARDRAIAYLDVISEELNRERPHNTGSHFAHDARAKSNP